MKEMGWGFHEYQKAPFSLIEEIWAFMQTEAKAIEDSKPRE